MEKIRYEKWAPAKVKRKKDGKVILAVFQERIWNSFMLWDGKHQYFVNPLEDEFLIPTPKEIEIIYENVNAWRKELFKIVNGEEKPTPTATVPKTEPKPKLETKLKPEFVVEEVKPKTVEEAPKPKVMSDFEILTADVEAL